MSDELFKTLPNGQWVLEKAYKYQTMGEMMANPKGDKSAEQIKNKPKPLSFDNDMDGVGQIYNDPTQSQHFDHIKLSSHDISNSYKLPDSRKLHVSSEMHKQITDAGYKLKRSDEGSEGGIAMYHHPDTGHHVNVFTSREGNEFKQSYKYEQFAHKDFNKEMQHHRLD